MRQVPPYAEALKAALLRNPSVAAAAREVGISRATAYRFLAEHEAELAIAALKAAPRALRFLRPIAVTGRLRGAR